MPTTYIPDAGSIVKNFQIITKGGIFDSTACIFRQGTWNAGKLNGPDCTITNYADSTSVNIRTGPYSNNSPNGTVSEYVFPKSSWSVFITNPDAGVDCTRYTQVFTNGVFDSTTETVDKKIKGLVTYNSKGYIIGFTFSEVA